MLRKLLIISLLWIVALPLSAQNIQVSAPNVVALDEQFNVSFSVESDESPTDFKWENSDDFQLVWGPTKGHSISYQNINGKVQQSTQYTYTYVLMPTKKGVFNIGRATATLKGKSISSNSVSIEVVSASSSSQPGNGGEAPSSGTNISKDDVFLRMSVSKTSAVVGEPLTLTLKLYQRVNIAGFENAKFPTFNGFWSQTTFAPNNIEFKRETYGDKIYNTALIRSYVVIPQKSGSLTIDPAELVLLVYVRNQARSMNSIFDAFNTDDYTTIRKRVVAPALKINVKALPAGAPASFGGGVGKFSIGAKLSNDNLKTNEASSLVVTITGNGNISLITAPKIQFPADLEVYDSKVTDKSDAGKGSLSGSKIFEFPFIPRSRGEYTIPPIEYSYYDTVAGKYVTVSTEPISFNVEQGSDTSYTQAPNLPTIERRGVKNLGEDIRYIVVKKPHFSRNSFWMSSPLYIILYVLVLLGALVAWYLLRRFEARKADVVGTKNRAATKMALRRLKLAGDFLSKNLYSAFYEELHRALLGFISDKLNMKVEDLTKENISERLVSGGTAEELSARFVALLDACEYARYSPDSGNAAMSAHYDEAVNVISLIDSSMKVVRKGNAINTLALVIALLLPLQSMAATVPADSLWDKGVNAYGTGNWQDAISAWEAISAEGYQAAELYYNIGNAYFKAGNNARAILNFERALKINPSYSDARFNLEFANSRIQDKIDVVPEFFLTGVMRKFSYTVSSNVWAFVAMLFFISTLALLLVFLLSASKSKRKLGFYAGIASLVLFFVSFSFARWQYSSYKSKDSAIIVAPISSAKSSPSDDTSNQLFVIHEGTKVKVLENIGEWSNIGLSDGRQGWLRTKDFEII